MSVIITKVDAFENVADSFENACVVCFKDCEIYSIGECEHPVCYECSTRMRVLCKQNECPICRQDLSKVIFCRKIEPFRHLENINRTGLYDRKFCISFSDNCIRSEFYSLLEYRCSKCDIPPLISFGALKDHLRKDHELYFCDLCSDNLKIFPFERRSYTRGDLATHRRKGDADDTSHRGHPLCEYCDERYLDRDELFRHLRREHYFCHFCDADGTNCFYGTYDSLRDHFKDDHFLCEEGSCANEKFTGAFRNDIDFKAHVYQVHGKSMTKAAAKQARTLEFEFTITPRPRGVESLRNNHQQRLGINNEDHNVLTEVKKKSTILDSRNEHEFPSLGAVPTSSYFLPNLSVRTQSYGQSGLARTKENFPALGNAVYVSDVNADADRNLLKYRAKPNQQIDGGKHSIKNKQSGMMIHVSNRPSVKVENISKEFPALPSSSKSKTRFVELNQSPDFEISPLYLNAASSKHRSLLVDSYASPAASSSSAKLTLIQPKNKESGRKVEANISPGMNSDNNFPQLAPVDPIMTTQWITNSKKDVKKNKLSTAQVLKSSKSIEKVEDSVKIRHPNKSENVCNNKITHKLNLNSEITKKNSDLKHADSNKKGKNLKHQLRDQKMDKSNNNDKSQLNKNSKENKANNSCPKSSNKAVEQNSSTECSGFENKPTGPPPGFTSIASSNPPPGFKNVVLNSVAKPVNNLTFISSLGESFNVTMTHQYHEPPNATKRNQTLVMEFKKVLKTSHALNEFKRISNMFRNNTYQAVPYYEHCRDALGSAFETMFPEFLALLPEIKKQQELYLVYCQELKTETRRKTMLDVCATCKQVLISKDLASHLMLHKLELNFPVLPGANNKTVCTRKND